VTDDGRQLIATGPISCTSGERVLVHAHQWLVEITLVED